MERTGFGWRLLLALVLTGVLAAVGYSVYQAGFSQGFIIGGAAGGTEGAPALGPAYPYYGWGFRPFFFPFFGPWLCFVGLGLFFLFGGFFRFWGWRGGYHHHPHGEHGYHRHGPVPPWAREDRPTEPGEEDAPSSAEV
jgi:hypothetical protein